MTSSEAQAEGGSGVQSSCSATSLPLQVPGPGALESARSLDRSQRLDPSLQLARGQMARLPELPGSWRCRCAGKAKTRFW